MPLPSNVTYGKVVGTFLTAVGDTPDDPDQEPQGVAATGLKFRFTPDLEPAIVRDATSTPPTMFALADISCTVGSDGSLLGPDGAPGVKLVASTNTALQPNGWTWRVVLSGQGFPNLQFSFQLDAGATVDLATVLQVPANPGGTLNAWLQAVQEASAARDEAIAAAAAGGLASWAPSTVYTTSAKVLNPAGDLVRATTAHTSGDSYDASKWAVIIPGAASLSASYLPLLTPVSTYTWNPDGTIASQTIGGVTTTFTWNSDGTLATETRAGVTRTYNYSGGTLAAVA